MIPLGLVGLMLGGVSALPGPAAPPETTTVYDASGLRVIHRATPTSDLVAVRLYLLGGTRQLTAETAGIEAWLLHAAVQEARRAMARTGSRTILDADADWTIVGFLALKEELDRAWGIFARWITGPALSAESLSETAIRRAREALLIAARRRYSHPDLRVHALATQAAFSDHPYGLDPEGTERSLTSMGREDIERYAREHFVKSRMLLVVVGDVSRTKVEGLVAATLGRLPRGQYQWTLPPPVPRRSSKWWVDDRPLSTNYVLGYFTGPDPRQSDYFAFYVATQLLSSRLHRFVRSERSLSYAVGAPFLDRAIPVGGIYASTSAPAQVLALMRREVWLMQNAEPYGFALSRFLDQFTLQQLAQNMTNDAQAEALGRAELLFGDYRVAADFVRRLRKVTLGQVRRAAALYMQQIQFAYLGDTTRMRGLW